MKNLDDYFNKFISHYELTKAAQELLIFSNKIFISQRNEKKNQNKTIKHKNSRSGQSMRNYAKVRKKTRKTSQSIKKNYHIRNDYKNSPSPAWDELRLT